MILTGRLVWDCEAVEERAGSSRAAVVGPGRGHQSIRNRLHWSEASTKTTQDVSAVPSENRSSETQEMGEGQTGEEGNLK
jgi:hypothetical protein